MINFKLTYFDKTWKTLDFETIPAITFFYNHEKKELFMDLTSFEDHEMPERVNELRLEISDDPTLNFAGGVVSLGYYVLRIIMKNAKREKSVYRTKYLNGFSFKLSRPARRTSYPFIDKDFFYEIKPLTFDLVEDTVFSIKFKKDHSLPWTIIKSLLKKNEIIVSFVDPLSMFQPIKSRIIKIKPVQNIRKEHENLLEVS